MKLKNIEEYIDANIDSFDFIDEVIKIDNVNEIRLESPVIKINYRNILYAIFGTWCVLDKTTKAWEPDFSVTLIYEENPLLAPNNYLYYESDGLYVSLYNYLSKLNGDISQLDDIDCEIVEE